MIGAPSKNGKTRLRPGGCFAGDDPAAIAAELTALKRQAAEAAKRLRVAPVPPLTVEVVEHLLRSLAGESDPVMRRWLLSSLIGPGGGA
jgi:hypothetical protein